MFGLQVQHWLCLLTWILRICAVEGYGDDDAYDSRWDVWHHRKTRNASATSLRCEKPDSFYICEDVPNSISAQSTKSCNYRNQEFQEQVYRWVAGRGCLLYTPDFLFVEGVNTIDLSSACIYGNLFAPCLEIPKADGTCGCFPFDPAVEEVSSVVRDALVPSAQGRWETCYEAASDCCDIMSSSSNDGQGQCPTTFDGWTCWRAAEADTLAEEVCSEFAYSNDGPSCHHYSTKYCTVNATWEIQTDYSPCSVTPRLLRRYRFYIAILAFSTASCLPAVLVFFMYKRLRITRVALHRNLLITIIVRNILVIVTRSEIYIDELTNSVDTVMSQHSVWCRTLAAGERLAGNAVFAAMLVEGVYLHRLIVAVFRAKMDIKWLYAISAVITTLPVAIWAAVMGVHDDRSCWLVYSVDYVQWILDAPRVTILIVNTILFADVLRVLLTKIRNAENANQLNTAKTTLFLMPIFGTQFILTAFRPNTTNCIGEQIYYYATYTVEGLQGFFVALLYCYINKEVHNLVKATYKKTEQAVVSRVRSESTIYRKSLGPNAHRRMTCSTDLPDPTQGDAKDQYAVTMPKLHVAEIISIQASERLADMLEPVYATVENGFDNQGYDSQERSDNDTVSSSERNNDVDDIYGFTNASSITIDCQDWIRRVSSPSMPSESISDSTEPQYAQPVSNSNNVARNEIDVTQTDTAHTTDIITDIDEESEMSNNIDNHMVERQMQNNNSHIQIPDDDMVSEILQFIEAQENGNFTLDPNVLSPNRADEDRIVFVDE